MRNLVVVAIVSALIGAALGHWATALTAANAQGGGSSARISPLDLMKSSKQLPVEVFENPM
jgi:hypothetical protein